MLIVRQHVHTTRGLKHLSYDARTNEQTEADTQRNGSIDSRLLGT